MNKVILVGNVGGEPKSGETSGGKKWASVSLATNEKWKDSKGEQQEKVSWHRLKFWGGLAGVVESYVKKGDKILVEGRIDYGSYVSKETELEVKTTDIVVLSMEMLSGKPRAAAASGSDDDLPF